MTSSGELSYNPEIERAVPFVLHGSFSKHLDEIGRVAETLTSSGIATVLAPHNCEAVRQEDGFVLLTGEEGHDPRELEAAYLEQVLSLRKYGGASMFIDPDGYVGKSAAYEAGIVQASGGRAFWTEQPKDVPFYVDPASVMPVETLVAYMHIHHGELPPVISASSDPIGQRWQALPLPTGHIAEGAIMRHGDRLLLVEDGRWGDQLTIPGTRVRTGETRATALGRLVQAKIGVTIRGVSPFATNFAIPGSSYNGPIDPNALVFEDHIIDVKDERSQPQDNVRPVWASTSEVEVLIRDELVEPNAASALGKYLLQLA